MRGLTVALSTTRKEKRKIKTPTVVIFAQGELNLKQVKRIRTVVDDDDEDDDEAVFSFFRRKKRLRRLNSWALIRKKEKNQ